MDRRNFNRIRAGFALALIVTTTLVGCRTTGDEVPPGRRNRRQHEPGTAAVEFSTQPSENPALAGPGSGPLGGAMGNLAPSTASSGGLAPYGAPTAGGFGPPGTAGSVPGSATPSNLLQMGQQPRTDDPAANRTSIFGRSGAASGPGPFDASGGLPPGTP